MRTLVLGFLASFFAATGVVAAPEHIEAYNAYNQALEDGDLTLAVSEAERAWRAAEKELGDDEKTAILAYNFAGWVYWSSPEDVLEPLGRAKALIRDEEEVFGADTASLMLAVARALSEEGYGGTERKLRAFLKTHLKKRRMDLLVTDGTLLYARAWATIAIEAAAAGKYSVAGEAGDEAVRQYQLQSDVPSAEVLLPMFIAAISRLHRLSRDDKDIIESYRLLDQAIDLYPEQKDADSLDSQLAMAMAWHAAVRGLAMSKSIRLDRLTGPADTSGSTSGERDSEDSLSSLTVEKVRWENAPDPAMCRIRWKHSEPPAYPVRAERQVEIGGALVAYELSEDMTTKNVRVLAEAPTTSGFGKSAVRAVEKWKGYSGLPLPSGCERNRLLTVTYTIQ